MRRMVCPRLFVVFLFTILSFKQSPAQESAAAGLVKLLTNDKLPSERRGQVAGLIAQRGDAVDLRMVFDLLLKPGQFTPAGRQTALDALAEAALTRRVIPKGNLEGLQQFLDNKKDPELRRTALRLVGLWKVTALRPRLAEVAYAEKENDSARSAALEGLVEYGDKEAQSAVEALLAEKMPVRIQLAGLSALARLNLDAALRQVGTVLARAGETDDLTQPLSAFVDAKGGSEKLAIALASAKLPADVGRLGLRALSALGRSDQALSDVFSKAAGIGTNPKVWTNKEITDLLAVVGKADPARGEKVFRRPELSCLNCHVVQGVGGNVGPELSAIGTNSPPEYLLRSILYPDESIKEEYQTVKVLTKRDLQFEGIVVEDNDDKLVLKDATGQRRTIAKKSIAERAKGNSLMPKGLAHYMTQAELADVVRFLSELGKPGPYALNAEPVLRRWRLLRQVDTVPEGIPDDLTFTTQVLKAPATAWTPFYSLTSGKLPLEDLSTVSPTRGRKSSFLQAEVEVKTAGVVGLKVDNVEGLTVWVGDQLVKSRTLMQINLPEGRHPITLRVDRQERKSPSLRLEVIRAKGSEAVAVPVGGNW